MPAMVDAGPSRDHVRHLLAKGMLQADIVRDSGVSQAAIGALIQGAYEPGRPEQKTVHEDTALRILAVEYRAPTRKSPTALSAPLEHGTVAGFERHRKAGSVPCELCAAARRGYQVGMRHKAKAAGPVMTPATVEALLKVCRAIVLRRPVPRIRELAIAALRAAEIDSADGGVETDQTKAAA